jgi:hypothetical protein
MICQTSKYAGCPKCGKYGLEQVSQGHAVSKVWGISVDGKVICEGLAYHAHKNIPVIFRCKDCLEPVAEELFNPQFKENNEQNDKKSD